MRREPFLKRDIRSFLLQHTFYMAEGYMFFEFEFIHTLNYKQVNTFDIEQFKKI